MKKIFSIFGLVFITFFAAAAGAQTPDKTDWVRLDSETREFSVAVPAGFQVFTDAKGYVMTSSEGLRVGKFGGIKIQNIRYLTASTGGATFYVIAYKINNLKIAFPFLSEGWAAGDRKTYTIKGKPVMTSSMRTDKFYYELTMIGVGDTVYQIFGGAKNDQNASLRHFFSSLKLDGNRLFAVESPLEGKVNEQASTFAALADTPFTVEQEKEESAPEKPKSAPTPAPDEPQLVILAKTKSLYTEEARRAGTQGKILLRVTFAANGAIEKVSIVKGLPNGLNESAVRAARLLRFLPLEKDGVPVTTSKMVEYSYTIY